MTTKTVTEKTNSLRWFNLNRLAGRYPSVAAFARAAGTNDAQMRRLLAASEDVPAGPANAFGERVARRIEKSLGLEDGWLDRTQGGLSAGEVTGNPDNAQEGVNVAGLLPLEVALVDTLVQLLRARKFSSGECIELLHHWKDRL